MGERLAAALKESRDGWRVETVLFEALYAESPPEMHGQLCPVWTRRRYPSKAKPCECWVEDKARRRAARLAAALAAPRSEPLDVERLTAALASLGRQAGRYAGPRARAELIVEADAAIRAALAPSEPLRAALERLVRSAQGRCIDPKCPSQHIGDGQDCIEAALAAALAPSEPTDG